MRTVVPVAPSSPVAQIEAEAWVVLEMHFLSRPYLRAEARARLAECLANLRAEGIVDARELKDRACRQVQMMYGPAPALNDDTVPVATHVA
ncbi:MAG: hypothetical protein EKK41_25760 [Hyphomicrobiales bacterium]|nr:MAG: hypothetical protein EKK41_25760 [Hyphomicrobiales bacterium]